jgi:hypothetical protein
VILYRAISRAEKIDYDTYDQLRTARNTLEGKQFFKSEIAVLEFASNANFRKYKPPYTFILRIGIDEDCLNAIDIDVQILDGFEAMTISEDDLKAFNNCINFVNQSELRSNI